MPGNVTKRIELLAINDHELRRRVDSFHSAVRVRRGTIIAVEWHCSKRVRRAIVTYQLPRTSGVLLVTGADDERAANDRDRDDHHARNVPGLGTTRS
jgi:hypothetical protein